MSETAKATRESTEKRGRIGDRNIASSELTRKNENDYSSSGTSSFDAESQLKRDTSNIVPSPDIELVSLDRLALKPRPVLCPACKNVGHTAVPRSRSKLGQTITNTIGNMIGTLFLGLLCLYWIVKFWWNEATQHATHFCASCGIHLVYWNGDTYVFAKDEYLTETVRENSEKEAGLEVSTTYKFARSPLGPPPVKMAQLYAFKRPLLPRNPYELKVKWDRQTDFLQSITDPSAQRTLLTVTTPRLEDHEWHPGQKVFLPFEKDREEAEKGKLWKPWPSERVETTLHFRWGPTDAESKPQTRVELTFDRYNWDISLFWPDRVPWRGRHDFGLKDGRCVTQNLYFPFLSSEGPLIWTTRKMGNVGGEPVPNRGKKTDDALVLVDAYDRVVAYGDLWVHDQNMSPELLGDILITYAAMRIQLQRLEQWGEAEKNQQEHEAAERASLG